MDTPRLSQMTSMEVGGPPSAYLAVQTEDELVALLKSDQTLPILPLGGGSNVVVSDAGVDALVVRILIGGVRILSGGDAPLVEVGAGVNWDEFVGQMVELGYSGVECLSGIPGSVGATPIQNVGAYGQEVSDTIEEVRALEIKSGEARWFSREECEFSYRDSYFKKAGKGRFIVTSVRFRLKSGGRTELRYGELKRAADAADTPLDLNGLRALVIDLRRKKSMVIDPQDENRRSCGSFFVNTQLTESALGELLKRCPEPPPTFPGDNGLFKIPSAWLIEQAGLHKGYRSGQVGLSTKHTLSVVAHEGACAADVVAFSWEVRRKVIEVFGVLLVPEPHFWGFGPLDEGLPSLPSLPAAGT